MVIESCSMLEDFRPHLSASGHTEVADEYKSASISNSSLLSPTPTELGYVFDLNPR